MTEPSVNLQVGAADEPSYDCCVKCGRPHVRRTKTGKLQPTCAGHRSDGEPCGNWPAVGEQTCAQRHGAGAPNRRLKILADIEDQRARASLARLGHAPPELGTAVDELIEVTRDMKALKEVLKARVEELEELHTVDRLGTQREKVVLVAYERALERLSRHLIECMKLDLENRRVVLDERRFRLMFEVMMQAGKMTGLDDAQLAELRRNLGVAASALASRERMLEAAADPRVGETPSIARHRLERATAALTL